ncbi:hypothetical protein F3P66_22135 [Agrobacterium fabrum]|nr:hypothetical protein F3P66_22135 [Agrobacterium fabrum]
MTEAICFRPPHRLFDLSRTVVDPVLLPVADAAKNRHETSVCPHNIPLLPFSRPPLFEKIVAQRSGMASGSPKARS